MYVLHDMLMCYIICYVWFPSLSCGLIPPQCCISFDLQVPTDGSADTATPSSSAAVHRIWTKYRAKA